MSRPLYQTFFVAIAAVSCVIILLGELLGAVESAVQFVTSALAFRLTLACVLFWILSVVYVRTRGVRWRLGSATVRISRLNLTAHCTFAAVIIFVWLPTLVSIAKGDQQTEVTVDSEASTLTANASESATQAPLDQSLYQQIMAAKDVLAQRDRVIPEEEVEAGAPVSPTQEDATVYNLPLVGAGPDCGQLVRKDDSFAKLTRSDQSEIRCTDHTSEVHLRWNYFGVAGGDFYEVHTHECAVDLLSERRPAYVGGSGALLKLECVTAPKMRPRLHVVSVSEKRVNCRDPVTFTWTESDIWAAEFKRTNHSDIFAERAVSLEFMPFAKGASYVVRLGNQELVITETEQNFDHGCSDFPAFLILHKFDCAIPSSDSEELIEAMNARPMLVRADAVLSKGVKLGLEVTLALCELPQ